MSNGREQQVVETFLALTDTLVSDFDALDFLTMLVERSGELLDVSAAGVILTDVRGHEKVPAGGQVAVFAGGHLRSPRVAK